MTAPRQKIPSWLLLMVTQEAFAGELLTPIRNAVYETFAHPLGLLGDVSVGVSSRYEDFERAKEKNIV